MSRHPTRAEATQFGPGRQLDERLGDKRDQNCRLPVLFLHNCGALQNGMWQRMVPGLTFPVAACAGMPETRNGANSHRPVD